MGCVAVSSYHGSTLTWDQNLLSALHQWLILRFVLEVVTGTLSAAKQDKATNDFRQLKPNRHKYSPIFLDTTYHQSQSV